eukprot:9677354-Lingulodinium_polyedra.AAC.1
MRTTQRWQGPAGPAAASWRGAGPAAASWPGPPPRARRRRVCPASPAIPGQNGTANARCEQGVGW